jgi:hypothetical protein
MEASTSAGVYIGITPTDADLVEKYTAFDSDVNGLQEWAQSVVDKKLAELLEIDEVINSD